jgi:HSP20 family protein
MLTRWDPFTEVLSLRDAMGRLLEESFVRPPALASGAASTTPLLTLPLNVYDNGNELVVNADLPGFRPEDVNISVDGDRLTIQAKSNESHEDKGKNYIVHETRYGSYTRTITLPTLVKADNAQATFENGVLHLSLPKSEQRRPLQIKVTAAAKPLTEGKTNSETRVEAH